MNKMMMIKVNQMFRNRSQIIKSKHCYFSTFNHKYAQTNCFGVPLISPTLHNKIFGTEQQPNKLTDDKLQLARKHLQKFGIKPVNEDTFDDYDYSNVIPKLNGNIENHFLDIASQQIKPYINICEVLKKSSLPPFPQKWAFQEGWVKYDENGISTPVPYPDEDIIVFDTENVVEDGPCSVMATAVSPSAWYSWCSSNLINNTNRKPKTSEYFHEDDFIPIGNPLLVIGHNVSFDRARIKDQYSINLSKTRFLDTMAMHIAVGGLTSSQRNLKLKFKNNDLALESIEAEKPKWFEVTTMNSLNDVYGFYLPNEKKLDKDVRNTFVKGTIQDVVDDFQNLMFYCASDVKATTLVFQKLFPIFRKRCPHPVTFSGMLTMSTSYLPVNESWFNYIRESDMVAEELNSELDILISKQAQEACQLCHDEQYKQDMWLWDLDWKIGDLRIKKITKKQEKQFKFPEHIQVKTELEQLEKQFYPLLCRSEILYKSQPRFPGYPKWFSDLCPRYEPFTVPLPGDLGYGKYYCIDILFFLYTQSFL